MMGDAIEGRAAHGGLNGGPIHLSIHGRGRAPAQGSHEVTLPCDLSASRYGIEASLEPSAILG